MKSSFVILALLGVLNAKQVKAKKQTTSDSLVSADSFASWGDGWETHNDNSRV